MAVTGCRYRRRNLFSHLLENQRSVWTRGDTPRRVSIATSVALDGLSTQNILPDGGEWTDQRARTAADALLLVDQDETAGLVPMHRAGQAGIDAGRIVAVLAAYGERLDLAVLDSNAADSGRLPHLQHVGDVIATGVMRLAVDAAKAAPNTELLSNQHASHRGLRVD